jgi:hypothetical protein
MTKGVKIGLISFGVIGMGVGAYFLIRYFKLKKAYETTLNTTDASLLINSKTAGVPDAIIPDEYTETADDFKGTEMDETDEYTDQELFEIQSGMGDF